MLKECPRLALLNISRRPLDEILCAVLTHHLHRWDIPSQVVVLGASDGDLFASLGRIPWARAPKRLEGSKVQGGEEWVHEFVSITGDADIAIVLHEGEALRRTVDGDEPSASDIGVNLSVLAGALDVLKTPVVLLAEYGDDLARRARSVAESISCPVHVLCRGSSAHLDVVKFGTDGVVQLLGHLDEMPAGEHADWHGGPALQGQLEGFARLETLNALISLAGTASPLHAAPLRVRASEHRTAPPLRGKAGGSKGRVLMVQGTTSNAGKTFLVTALARYFSNRGLSVAPFKGQNMSNNARVVDGGEIGTAQYLQAMAARVKADVRMNPVLIKPQALGSQLLLNGKLDVAVSALPWRLRKPLCWEPVQSALESLRAEHDLIIVEGAGSPMETYLKDNDVVNMRVAKECRANVLLATDAARGGGFAHLFGTWTLLPDDEKELIKGYILNLFFRVGNPALLKSGCEHITRVTGGIPVLGIVPEIPHALPDEDLYSLESKPPGAGQRVAILAYPQLSNFDEFKPLEALKGIALVWASKPEQLEGADLIILPGSKHVAADIAWLRDQGLVQPVVAHATAGRRVLGICGGLQMLGRTIEDPTGMEGSGEGIGLLPIRTVHHREKIQRRVGVQFSNIPGSWRALGNLAVEGYEIRHGRSAICLEDATHVTRGMVTEVLDDGVGFASNNVLAVYIHGLFENSSVLEACFGQKAQPESDLESTFELLSDTVEKYLDVSLLERIAVG